MDIRQILTDAVKCGASDVFIVSGAALAYKIAGRVVPQNDGFLKPDDTKEAVMDIFALADIDITDHKDIKHEMDFSFSIAGTSPPSFAGTSCCVTTAFSTIESCTLI